MTLRVYPTLHTPLVATTGEAVGTDCMASQIKSKSRPNDQKKKVFYDVRGGIGARDD